MSEQEQNPPATVNAFMSLLQNHREGYTLQDLSEELQKLVQSVRQTGRKGKMTLTVEVSPASKGAGNAVTVKDDIKSTMPRLERETSIFFAADDFTLHRQDPRQKELALKVVNTVSEPIKKVVSQ